MGKNEKSALIDSLTIKLVEDYNLPIKEIKGKITEILQLYRVNLNESLIGDTDTSTDYLLRKFREGKQAVGMNEKTVRQYEIAVKTIEDFTGKQLSDIESDDINAFLKDYSNRVSSVTVRAKYQLLSSVYTYLFNHRFLAHNPIIYVDVPKATIKYKTPMTDVDLEKIKKVCEDLPELESTRNMALIHFLVSTGCRVSEVTNVKIKDVNFATKVCTVMGKGRKERPVILNDKCIYRLKLYLNLRKDTSPEAPLFAHIRGEETKMTKDGVGHVIDKLRTQAGVSKVTCHSFRRYYATDLRKRNVSIQMIASSLGHANVNQIGRYSIYSNNEMIDTIRSSMI